MPNEADQTQTQRRTSWLSRIPVSILISLFSLAISGFAAYEASQSAGAAKESAKAATENLRVGQRAYVGASRADMLPVRNDKPERVLLQLSNSGRTPALHLSISFKMQYRANEPTAADFAALPPSSSISSVLPNGTSPVMIVANSALTAADRKAIDEHQAKLYVWGHVEYVDVFGTRQETTYCAWYDKLKNYFANCAIPSEMT